MSQAFYQWGYDIDEERFFETLIVDGEHHEAEFSWEQIGVFAKMLDNIITAAQIAKAENDKRKMLLQAAMDDPLAGTRPLWEARRDGAR